MQLRSSLPSLIVTLCVCLSACGAPVDVDQIGTSRQALAIATSVHPGTAWGTWWDFGGNSLEASGNNTLTVGPKGRLSVPSPYDSMTAGFRRTTLYSNEIVQVEAGYDHVVVLKADHTVWVNGRSVGSAGLCLGSSVFEVGQFTQIVLASTGTVPPIEAIAVNGWTTFMKQQGSNRWFVCGRNAEGELGDGTTTFRSRPTLNSLLDGFVRLIPGAYHTLGLKQGTPGPYCWGDSPADAPTCGYNGGHILSPALMQWPNPPAATPIVDLAAGERFSVVLGADGICPLGRARIVTMGDNTHGAMGLADPNAHNDGVCLIDTPTGQIWAPGTVRTGRYHTIILGADINFHSDIYVSGDNSWGQLGLGDMTNRFAWTASVTAPTVVPTGLAASAWGSFFSTGGGTDLIATGRNDVNQLGLSCCRGGPVTTWNHSWLSVSPP